MIAVIFEVWQRPSVIQAVARPGTICLSSSSHFPLIAYSNAMKPVTLPPGRAKLLTKPRLQPGPQVSQSNAHLQPDDKQPNSRQSKDCMIKGNINDRGRHIYHMPGDKFYSRTIISVAKGERWFCSEAEAKAAGWQRSRR